MPKQIKFHGATSRGRITVQDSLAAAVEEVAFLERKDPAQCETYQSDTAPDVWYVYETQSALDVDMSRGSITSNSPGWFAIVTAEEQTAAPERK